jgi:hypothetical protein
VIALRAAVFSLVALPFISGGLFADGQPYTVFGKGNESCGKWVQERRANDWATTTSESWLAGYVTAYNRWVALLGGDITHGIDLDGLLAWIDSYCGQHPLNKVSTAAEALIFSLEDRRR